MTHTLMAFTAEGDLAYAQPVQCRDDEEFERFTKRFKKDYVDEEIGDVFGFVTEDQLTTFQSMNDGEVHETGV